MDKLGCVLNNKKEQTIGTCNRIDVYHILNMKQKKPDTRVYLYDNFI